MTRPDPEPSYRCPVCGTVSGMVLNVEQAFCTNDADGPDGCRVLMFNPSLPDGGLSDPQFVDLERPRDQ